MEKYRILEEKLPNGESEFFVIKTRLIGKYVKNSLAFDNIHDCEKERIRLNNRVVEPKIYCDSQFISKYFIS